MSKYPHVKLTVGPDTTDTRVVMDGVDITRLLYAVRLDISVGYVPRLELRYRCQQVEIDGEIRIDHYCPRSIGDEPVATVPAICPDCEELVFCDYDCPNPYGREQEPSP